MEAISVNLIVVSWTQLREMKGSLDQSHPEDYPHLKRRAKQEQVRHSFALHWMELRRAP